VGGSIPERQTGVVRELVVLGTASQAPTRTRNHNGYLLRWDGEGVLFDPGEGTQRQLLLAGVAASAITRICITHFHGDHCLGLPGVVQRLSLDRVPGPVDICYPASGQVFVERLLGASVWTPQTELRLCPVSSAGVVAPGPPLRVRAARLAHEPETFGWRVEEPDGFSVQAERLAEVGLAGPGTGPLVGELVRSGHVTAPDGRQVLLRQVAVRRPGQAMAFVMDTGRCPEAVDLARGVDLLVCESTFAAADVALARAYRHLTTVDAAELAAEAGARLLVLTHFSQRYRDVGPLVEEARQVFPNVVAATDLSRVPVPPRLASAPGPMPPPGPMRPPNRAPLASTAGPPDETIRPG